MMLVKSLELRFYPSKCMIYIILMMTNICGIFISLYLILYLTNKMVEGFFYVCLLYKKCYRFVLYNVEGCWTFL